MSKQLYGERDVMALDEAGGFYMRHVMAMTNEKLHSKMAIAAELGYRDMRIAELEASILKYEEAFKQLFARCGSSGIFTAWGGRIDCSILNEAHRLAGKALGDAAPLTVENAPVGTLAPAIMGGRWYRTELGWKWNGPDGSGGTFPRPGGNWGGELIAPNVDGGTE